MYFYIRIRFFFFMAYNPRGWAGTWSKRTHIIYVCICTCTCVCIYTCIHICIYLCIYVCVTYLWIYTYIRTHVYIHICIYVHTYTYMCMHQIYLGTHSTKCVCIYIHIHLILLCLFSLRTHPLVCVCVCIYKHTNIYIYIFIYVHTYTHIYVPDFLGTHPTGLPRGWAGTRRKPLSDKYFKRVEAVEFTIKQDDGAQCRNLQKADVILLGVSRSRC